MQKHLETHQKPAFIDPKSAHHPSRNLNIEQRRFVENSLIESWLKLKESDQTKRVYRQKVKDFFSVVPVTLDLVRQRHFAHYIDSRPHLSRSSKRMTRNVLSSLFEFLILEDYLDKNPFKSLVIKVPEKTSQRHLTRGEVTSLIEAAEEGRDRVIIKTLYFTGLRVSELCSLTFEHFRIDGEDASFWVEGKGGRIRTIYIDKKFFEVIFSLKEDRELSSFIFRSKRSEDSGLIARDVDRIVKKWAVRAKVRLKGDGKSTLISAHWLRHSHATHSIENGAKIHVVRDTLGHESLATTNRYVAMAEKESSFSSL